MSTVFGAEASKRKNMSERENHFEKAKNDLKTTHAPHQSLQNEAILH